MFSPARKLLRQILAEIPACAPYTVCSVDLAKGKTQVLVRDLLSSKASGVVSIRANEAVAAALEKMEHHGIGSLVVMEDDKMHGIITERDYARMIIVAGKSSHDVRVSEIMTREVITAGNDASIDECMVLMTEHRIRHLPVVDQESVVGVLSIRDLTRAIVEHNEEALRRMDDRARD